MKIYCAHSSNFNYKDEWYDVLRKNISSDCTLIFPHESREVEQDSYETISSTDCVIAEVSYPSTGMGIELGWAHSQGKPIFCFYKAGTAPSKSLGAITRNCTSYSSQKELISLIFQSLSHEMNHIN